MFPTTLTETFYGTYYPEYYAYATEGGKFYY